MQWFQVAGAAISCMEGTAVWEDLQPYFELVRGIREMTEKAVAGQYGGPKPRTWFRKGAIMKKGDHVYVLSNQFREDRKKKKILSHAHCYLPVIEVWLVV